MKLYYHQLKENLDSLIWDIEVIEYELKDRIIQVENNNLTIDSCQSSNQSNFKRMNEIDAKLRKLKDDKKTIEHHMNLYELYKEKQPYLRELWNTRHLMR